MPTANGYSQELKRDLYRDLAAKQHLSMRMERTRRSFACDAMETETAEDYCKRMLAKLGLKASADPVADLSLFLQGHEAGARDNQIPGNRLAGGNRVAIPGEKLLGAGMDGGELTWVEKKFLGME